MPWTEPALVNSYITEVDLIAEPTAFDNSITIAEQDLKARLRVFISDAIIDTWTLVANTPEIVVGWATEMAAAYYFSTYQGFHLQPEIPNNPAAIIYDRVLKQVEKAKRSGMVIMDVAGARVPVSGISVTGPTASGEAGYRYTEWLPKSQGGEVDD